MIRDLMPALRELAGAGPGEVLALDVPRLLWAGLWVSILCFLLSLQPGPAAH